MSENGSNQSNNQSKLGPVQRIKKNKRNRDVSVDSGVSRRAFLTYLGASSAALAAGSAGIFTKEAGAQEFAGAASTPFRYGDPRYLTFFTPIEPTEADELVLPSGFR